MWVSIFCRIPFCISDTYTAYIHKNKLLIITLLLNVLVTSFMVFNIGLNRESFATYLTMVGLLSVMYPQMHFQVASLGELHVANCALMLLQALQMHCFHVETQTVSRGIRPATVIPFAWVDFPTIAFFGRWHVTLICEEFSGILVYRLRILQLNL